MSFQFEQTTPDIHKPSIGICMVATNLYLKKWFDVAKDLENTPLEKLSTVTIHLFTDNTVLAKQWAFVNLKNTIIKVYQIQSWGWPEATLYRYKFISEKVEELNDDILMYLDSDMRVLGDFSTQLNFQKWNSKVALVQHPGFYRNKGLSGILDFFYTPKLIISLIKKIIYRNKGYGTWELNIKSTAFVPKNFRRMYFHGAVWLGYRSKFIDMCAELALNVERDLANNYIALWHDESHLNHYAAYNDIYLLNPSFSGVKKYKNLRKYKFMIVTSEKKFGEGRAPTLPKTHVS